MKCSFCGNNVPDGSELCPSCGMILSLGDEEITEASIPEYTPNVFGSEPIVATETDPSPAVRAPAAAAEPEVFEAPAYETASVEFETPAYEEAPAEPEVYEAPVYEEAAAEPEVYEAPVYEEAAAEPEVYEAPEYESVSAQSEVAEELPEVQEEYVAPEEVQEEFATDDASYPEYESFVDEEEEQAIVDDMLNDETDEDEDIPVLVPVSEDEPAEEEEYDEVEADNDDDTYIKSGKKGVGTIVALCVLLVCLVAAGGYVFNRLVPSKGTTTTEPTVSDFVNADADVEETDEADDVTEEDLTDEDDVQTTTAPSSEDETTTKPSTTENKASDGQSTTKGQTTTKYTTTRYQSTTKYTTTKRQTTTRNQTTTRRSTTKPSTTKPSTTKPTTTDPYGINDVTLQKPSQYLSKTYHAYVNVSSVKMRAKPAESADRVQYLEKGSEVIVYAKQNGFCYVYSTRFGTYGWIASSYLSDSRPVESTTAVKKNTVSPDVNGSGETKYTTNTLNLRKGPSTDYDVIKTVPINYPVKIVGYKSGASGWAYVTDLTTGTNGWVSTAYLK